MSNGYVCSLNETILKRAFEELYENPKERLGAVQTFREWILSQKHIKCPVDTIFLLKFLRAAKFSQLVARKWLTNYLTTTTKRPELFANIDMADKKIQAVLRSGYIVFPERRESHGRQLVIIRTGMLDTTFKHYDKESMYKAVLGANLHFLGQEAVQVTGFDFILDSTGFTMAQSNVWNMDDMKLNGVLTNQCFPGRITTYNLYNFNPIMVVLFDFFKGFVTKKMRDRIHQHGSNLESLYKIVPMECLPEEYLPDDYTGPHCGSIDTIIENFAKRTAQPDVRDRILRETIQSNLHIDLNKSETANIPQESFRKLNLD